MGGLLTIKTNYEKIEYSFTQQKKRDMVTFIMSHYKHRVSLQHSVTLSTDTIEGTNW